MLPVGLATAAALLFLMNRLDEEIRSQVQAMFVDSYPELLVTVHSAQRLEEQGIYIRGLSIKDPTVEGPASEMMFIDEVFLKGRTTLDRLIEGDVAIDHMAFRRMTLRAVRGADGTWNLGKLWPPPVITDETPPMSVERSTVELYLADGDNPAPIVLRDVNLDIIPREDLHQAGPVGPTGPAAGSNAAPEHNQPQVHSGGTDLPAGPCWPPFEINGTIRGDHFEQIDISSLVDTTTCGVQVGGQITRLRVSPELTASLPSEVSSQAAALGNLRGLADLEFSFSTAPDDNNAPTFSAGGEFHSGTWDDPSVPSKFTDIRTQFQIAPTGWRLEGLTARSGNATVQLSVRKEGFAEDSPLWLTASARSLQLDSTLPQFLPAELQSVWYQYLPSGQIDADLTLEFDGERWSPDLLVNCGNVSFTYYQFPYPMTHTTGQIRARGNSVQFNLAGRAAGQTIVRWSGSLEQQQETYVGWIDYATDGFIPIDNKLLASLDTPDLRQSKMILESLGASGNLQASGRMERASVDDPEWTSTLRLDFDQCSVQYSEFPYPLRNVRGVVELAEGEWTFRDFVGQNDSGRVTAMGKYTTDEAGELLAVDFDITNLPLEDELRDALPTDGRQAWNDLRPRGSIDRAKMTLRYRPATDELAMRVVAEKWPQEHNPQGLTVSLYPTTFPYALNQVTGLFVYENGRFDFKNMQASHGDVRLGATGYTQADAEGNWLLEFTQLFADQMVFDRELLAALPTELADGVAQLNLVGRVNMTGGMRFAGVRDPSVPVACAWDVTLDMENGAINPGVALNNIHGGIRLIGQRDAERFYCRGELGIDSLMVQNHQLTNIAGPVWIDQTRVSFGQWAEQPQPGQPPRRVIGQTYGGKFNADLHIDLQNKSPRGESQFVLQAELDKADLASFARVNVPGQRNITGKTSGWIRLGGTCSANETLRGNGRVFLTDADIYELPLMVALLKIVSIKRPDSTAFTESNIDFQVAGEHVYLSRIDFNGDAISLKGNGDVGLDGQVNLKFFTQVGRDQNPLALIRPLLADASKRILMIEVTGTLDKPNTTRNVLPGLNNTLDQIFSEQEAGRRAQPRQPAATPPLTGRRRIWQIFR